MSQDFDAPTAVAPPLLPTASRDEEWAAFLPNYLLYLLARASHLVSADFHRRLAAQGLTVPVWRTLATLSSGDGLTIGRLSEITLLKQPTVTKIVDRLEAEGLVQRVQGPRDRRQVLVYITEKGRARAAVPIAQAVAHEREVTASYSAEELGTLKHVLRTLIERLEKE